MDHRGVWAGRPNRNTPPCQPRLQTGLRYRPNEIFSVDLIYGHNITGENANWITVGTTIRFPVPGGQSDHMQVICKRPFGAAPSPPLNSRK